MKRKSLIALIVAITLLLATTALVIGVSAAGNSPALDINGANISFERSVHVFYSVGYENIDAPENIKLLVWREADDLNIKGCTLGTEDYVLTQQSYEVDEGKAWGKVFKFEELSAAEMTENIYARAYVEQDGEIIYSSVKKYSILQYALNKLGVTGTISPNENFREMLRTMLDYGTAAQNYFGVNTDRLANGNYVTVSVNGATLPDGTAAGLFAVGEEVSLTAEPTPENPYVTWKDANGKLLSAKETYTFSASANMTYTATLSDVASSFGMYDRVVFVGIDGAGGSLFANANMTNTQAIFAGGATTYDMLTNPSVSANSWASILHGVETEDHGVLDNEQVETTAFPTDSKFPSVFRVIREANGNAKLASIATWGGINTGIVEDGFDVYKYKNGDANGTAEAVRYIKENSDFELLYVHLNDPDAAGHGYGYGSTEYQAKMTATDNNIGAIWQALVESNMTEDTLFIVTTDHGGVDKGHGGMTDAEKRVFFGATGKTVANGTIGEMENRDCAAIVLYALGYEQPETYTARVPSGLFEGVSASERPTYYDADNHRDVLSSGTTPSADSEDYVTHFVDNGLFVYMPFDGNAKDMYGSTTSENGTVSYEDGYFGSAANLDDGYILLNSIAPGKNSFTVALWMKMPSAFRKSPILTNISWNEANGKNKGYVFAVDDQAGPGAIFNVGDDTTAYPLTASLPADYNRGWMHVILVVDREANELRLSFDFGEATVLELPDSFLTVDLTNSQHNLAIGDSTQGKAPHKVSLTVDEFMIFDGAFNNNDINGLSEYFAKTPALVGEEETEGSRDHAENIPTPAPTDDKHLSKYDDALWGTIDYYLPFDMAINNAAKPENIVEAVGDTTYTSDGYFGQGLHLRVASNYLKLPDLSYDKNSFSIGLWVATDTLLGSTVPILSSQDYSASSAKQGFTFYLSNSNKAGFVLTDGSNRITDSFALPEDYKDGWMYVMFVLDRENKEYRISYDFGEFMTGSLAGYEAVSAAFAEGNCWAIGNDANGGYWTAMSPTVDELMIFNKAVGASDLETLKSYFSQGATPAKTPLPDSGKYVTDYLNTAPTVYLPLDGTYADAMGNTVNIVGELPYIGRGYFSRAAEFKANAAYLRIPEVKFGTGSFAVSSWININDFTSGSNCPIFSTQSSDSTVSIAKTQGFTLALGISSGQKYFEFSMGNGIVVDHALTNSSSNYYMDVKHNISDDMIGEWNHVALSVDRAAKTYTIYLNFEVFATGGLYHNNSSTYLPASISADGVDGNFFTIAQAGNGTRWTYMSAALDEVMVFNSALTLSDMQDLADYFGQAEIDLITDHIDGDKLGYYFDFNGDTANGGKSTATITEQGTLTYGEGYDGSSVNFSNGYITLDDTIGTDSFSVGFWIKTSSFSGSSVVLGTSDWTNGSNKGVIIQVGATNITVNHGNGSTRSQGKLTMTEGWASEWTYVAVVYDREASTVKISVNFGEFNTYDFSAMSGVSADGADGNSMNVGQDGTGAYWAKLTANIDELVIYDGVFTDEDLASLATFYGVRS